MGHIQIYIFLQSHHAPSPRLCFTATAWVDACRRHLETEPKAPCPQLGTECQLQPTSCFLNIQRWNLLQYAWLLTSFDSCKNLALHYAYAHGLPQLAFELIKCSDRAVSTAEFPDKHPPRAKFNQFQRSCMSVKKTLVLTNCCGKNKTVIVKIVQW